MSTPHQRRCSNCDGPMRVLTLAAHYQRTVEIDTCDDCGLIWFDEVESVRLAGPGILDLVHTIHAAMSAVRSAATNTLSHRQSCPVCGSGLEKVFNVSRFGRTAHWKCPRDHGYYQTYMLYLAEKGLVRPLQWKEASILSRGDRQLFCANCGSGLPNGPCEQCPACQSAIGVLDPARLASAIDIDGLVEQTGALAQAPTLKQTHCDHCGGAVDVTRDLFCPHCKAKIRAPALEPSKLAMAAVESTVRQNYASQLPKATLARLKAIEGTSAHGSYFDNLIAGKAHNFKLKLIGAIVVSASLLSLYAIMKRSTGDGSGQVAADQNATLAWFEQRYAEPTIRCAADAAARKAVQVRMIPVPVGATADLPAQVAPGAAMHAALADINRARNLWQSGKPFEDLLMRYSGIDQFDQPPPPFVQRGELAPRLERVAFCLGVNEISPVIYSGQSFYILQVTGAQN